jgi:hypothetical protein
MINTTLLRKARWAIASLLLAGSVGAATLFSAATSAQAPEPARLTQPLAGLYGSSASGVYVYSNQATSVLKWSASYVATANPPAAGTPCATADMGTGTTTTKVIVAYNAYRKCG